MRNTISSKTKMTGRKIMQIRHSWDFEEVKWAAKPRDHRSRKITRLKGVKVRTLVNRMLNKINGGQDYDTEA